MPTPPRTIPIIVLAGQSNAANAAVCDAVFAQVVAEGGLLVHSAVGGTPLSPDIPNPSGDWSASPQDGAGELFATMMAQIAAMLDPNSPSYVPGAYLDRVIWVQGEADSWYASAARDYFNQLQAFHAAMTDRFGTHDLVISALSDAAINGQTVSDAHRQNYALIQAAQLALAASDPTVQVIDPDVVAANAHFTPKQMLVWDYVHYNTASGFASALGKALATAGGHAAQALLGAATTQTGPHYTIGSSGDDVLTASATGIGQVYGSGGTDTLRLTDRTDGVRVSGGGINDIRIHAGGGNAFFLDLVSVEALVLTPGRDVVLMGAGLRRVDTGAGNDQVNGLAGHDTILLGSGTDRSDGGSGNDSIHGGEGFDFLSGGSGNDLLDGGLWADTLSGGDGSDQLIGGLGHDKLTGGTGADVFSFTTRDGSDRITDFQDGVDRIALQGASRDSLRILASGNSTVLQWGDLTLCLDGIAPAQITSSDLIFG